MVVVLAFLGGASMQAMPVSDAALATKASAMMVGCADMDMTHDSSAPMPHKGISPDCLKLMQCLGIPDGTVTAIVAEAPVRYAAVAYWSASARMHGVATAPSPFPPRLT